MEVEKNYTKGNIESLSIQLHVMREHVTLDKTYQFAIEIFMFCTGIQEEHQEYSMARQLVKSGNSPVILVHEAQYAESRCDFSHQPYIALKEIDEAIYWLEVLRRTDYVSPEHYQTYFDRATQVRKILTASVETTQPLNLLNS